MCFLCDGIEKEVGRQPASGSCPQCGGQVEAIDVESHWSFCFLPLGFRLKRKYSCTLCRRPLVLNL